MHAHTHAHTHTHTHTNETLLPIARIADECLDCFFGVLHGEMDLSSLDQQALQAFKKDHNEEVRNNPMLSNILFVVLKKLS